MVVIIGIIYHFYTFSYFTAFPMETIPNGWATQKGAPVTVLLGAQWGDEGKGKIIDFLIQHEKVCFRY